MANLSQLNVGGTTYDIKDTKARNDAAAAATEAADAMATAEGAALKGVTIATTATQVGVTVAQQEDTSKQGLIPSATATKAGAMSAEDKASLEAFKTGDLPLVTPTLTVDWSYQNKAGTSVAANSMVPPPAASNPVVEFGYKATATATFKYVTTTGKKNPTAIVSGSNWTNLPAANTNSSTYTNTFVCSAAPAVLAKISAPKAGLVYDASTGIIKAASGELAYAEARQNVTFAGKMYWGVTDAASANETSVEALSGYQLGGSSTSIAINLSDTQRFFFAVPMDFGPITTPTKIYSNGLTEAAYGTENYTAAFPLLGTISLTNAAGVQVRYKVYSCGYGAIKNKTITFKWS